MAPEKDRYLIVGLGELVWDLFPEQERLGGAPANVAYHATVLGDRGRLLTRLGRDARGEKAHALLEAKGVDITAVQWDAQRATGTVRVSMVAGEPHYQIADDAAWTAPQWTPAWQDAVAQADAVCFGSVLQAFAPGRAVLRCLVDALPPHALRLLDLNLRPPFDTAEAIEAALAAANLLKLNEAEARRLATQFEVRDLPQWLHDKYAISLVAITRGAAGSVIYHAGREVTHPGVTLAEQDAAADPVGAGDAFTAALVYHLVRHHDIDEASQAANRYAAYVASQAGAMPPAPAGKVDCEAAGATLD